MNLLLAIVIAITNILISLECCAINLVRDAESEAVIEQIVRPVFAAARLSGKIKVNLIQNDEINAFVLDGNNIFINTGLITFSNNPEAITGVIAHECAHIKEGHIVRGGDKAKDLIAANILGTVIGLVGIASGQADLGAATIMGSNEITTRNMIGYIRNNEHSADIGANMLMKKLNIPSDGLISLIHKLDHQSRASGYGEMPAYLHTHPLSRQRIDFINRNPTYDERKPIGLLTKSLRHKFAMVNAKIYAFTHAPKDTLSKYSGKSDFHRYAQSIALFRLHRPSEALGKLNDLLRASPQDPYLHELKGQFYLESRNLDQAINSYRAANELLPNSSLMQLQLAAALVHDGKKEDLKQAIELLKTVSNLEQSNALVWWQISRAYGKLGDNFASQVALAKRASLLHDRHQKERFLIFAKKCPVTTQDAFMLRIYNDMIHA